MTDKALELIKKEMEQKTGKLNLKKTGLTEIPAAIMEMPWLTSLKLSLNEIREIKHISTLINLQILYLDHNKITDINNLSTLQDLEALHLAYNNIDEIKNLSHLTKLTELYLYNNDIREIENLDALVNLEILALNENRISEIKNLNRLNKLTILGLNLNQISEIKNLNKLVNLEALALSGNPLTGIKDLRYLIELPRLDNLVLQPLQPNDLNIPPEIFSSGDSLPALRGYFASLKKGQFQVKELPIILVGNSTAGKTSLRYFLQRNVFPPPQDHSTHGIEASIWQPDEETFENIREEYKLKDTRFYFWDFGGQEYYHSTHRLFFSKKAIYIIVWEQKTNKQGMEKMEVKILQPDGTIETTELPVELFPYEYWFSSIRHMAPDAKESPVLLLQNKIDEAGNEKIMHPDPALIEKNNGAVLQLSIKEAYETNGQGKKDKYVDLLLEKIFSAAKDLVSTTVYGGLWEDIKKMLQDVRKENIWSPQQMLAGLRQLDPILHENSVLSYALSLRAMGFIIYEPEDPVLKNYLFINPAWVTEQIYSILDQSVLQAEGEFSMAHVIAKVGKDLADIFIALMKKFELIFENEEIEGFIAPQYLPGALTDKRKLAELKAKFDLDKPDFTLQFADFMPRQVMQRFLVAYGKKAAGKYYWKNGIAFTLRKTNVLVRCDYEKKEFRVYTEKSNYFIQRLVFEKLIQLSENKNSLQVARGDGDFVGYNSLLDEFPSGKFSGNKTIKSVNGNRTVLEAFKHFFEPIALVKDESSMIPSTPLKPIRVKLFISYAHADNQNGLVDLFVKEMSAQLKALEDDYAFTIFKDDQIIMGSSWDTSLEKEVVAADVAILLLSSSFLQSQYINKKELAVFLGRNINGGQTILAPVYFDPFIFSRYTLLKPYQFFKPAGRMYGPEYAHHGDDLCYGDLVKFDPQSGMPLPNGNRSRYMIDFVEELEKALNSKYGNGGNNG